MRNTFTARIDDIVSFKKRISFFTKRFSRFCILESNRWQGNNNEMIVAFDSLDEIIPEGNSFQALKKFYEEKQDWVFGFLSYDLKNEIENLSSGNFDGIGFPQMHFFQPKYVFRLVPNSLKGEVKGHSVEIYFLPEISSESEVENLFYEISGCPQPATRRQFPVELQNRVSRGEYIKTISKIKNHIQRGDIYEMNYCMEYFAADAEIDPAEVFLELNETSHAPFSAFYRMDDKYLMCASPERFLKKERKKIISEPIKGTAKREKNPEEDLLQKEKLATSVKDKSENVMIVDLVRNDLSRTCENVKVDELFGIYSFKQWHQMISTVSGEMKKEVHFTGVIKNAFPMGSMTGAPKLNAMKLIEQYEKTKRGLYSGAVGYITSDGNFDFNVIIRSILYNSTSKYLSFQVGSAITANSIPEDEYEECLLKAKGMLTALGAENSKSQNTNPKEFQNSKPEIHNSLV